MVQWEHNSSILLILTENANKCLYFFFFLFTPENLPTLCNFLVKMS